jgi:hypothetical protein
MIRLHTGRQHRIHCRTEEGRRRGRRRIEHNGDLVTRHAHGGQRRKIFGLGQSALNGQRRVGFGRRPGMKRPKAISVKWKPQRFNGSTAP